jgi:hypothetical protein
MKTEQFDDAFRRKIGGISPPFDDAEVDRINDYVNINKTPTFWGKYSKIASYTLGTVLVTGIIASILTQHYENKDLRSQLVSLQNKMDKSATPSVIVKKDTVYITQKQPSYLSLNSTIQKKVADIQKSSNTYQGFEQLSPAQKDKILTSYLLQKRGEVANIIDNVNVLFQEKNTQLSEKQEDRVISQEGNNKISAKSNTYFPENSLAKNNEKVLNFEQEKSENSEENNNSISLKNLTYRVGLGTDFYNGHLSAGLWTEIFFHKNWSVNVGLKSAEFREEDIHSEDGFEYKKGKAFRPNYAPNLPQKFNIEDIRSSNMIIQIPLNLNYHAPLKNGFAVIVGAGTVFDIAGKNRINFNFKDPSRGGVTESSNPSLNSGVKTTFFNNVELSVGVEKRFNRFVFQANPYWTTQLQNVNYKPDLNSWGLRFRGLYNFGQR